MARALAGTRAVVAGRPLVSSRYTTPVSAPSVPDPPEQPPLPNAPVISSLTTEAVTEVGVTFRVVVDQPVQCQVFYDTDAGTVAADYAFSSEKELSYTYSTHVQVVTGLTPGTLYHYRAVVSNSAAQEVTSAEGTFTTEAAPAVASGAYGPPVFADSLFNEYIGGPDANQLSYRFRATQSAVLSSIRVYTIVYNAGGYSAGDGGKARVRIYADDGTASHLPTGAALATSSTFTPGNPPSTDFPVFTFSGGWAAVAGTLYHAVFDNPHASPASNYMSLDQLIDMSTPPAQYQPGFANVDWGFLVKEGAGAWGERSPFPQFTPLADIRYANGTAQGMGYMETGNPSGYAYIGGSSMVRERFTVSGGNRTVTGMGCALTRLSGTGALTVRLENGDGSLIEALTFAAAAIPIDTGDGEGRGALTRLYDDFAASHVLLSGSTYNIRLSAPSGTQYRVHSLRRGSAYGFHPSTYFADGVGQKSTNSGSSWTGVYWTNDEDIMVTLGTA